MAKNVDPIKIKNWGSEVNGLIKAGIGENVNKIADKLNGLTYDDWHGGDCQRCLNDFISTANHLNEFSKLFSKAMGGALNEAAAHVNKTLLAHNATQGLKFAEMELVDLKTIKDKDVEADTVGGDAAKVNAVLTELEHHVKCIQIAIEDMGSKINELDGQGGGLQETSVGAEIKNGLQKVLRREWETIKKDLDTCLNNINVVKTDLASL